MCEAEVFPPVNMCRWPIMCEVEVFLSVNLYWENYVDCLLCVKLNCVYQSRCVDSLLCVKPKCF